MLPSPLRSPVARRLAAAAALALAATPLRAQGAGAATAEPERKKPFAAFSETAIALKDSLLAATRAQVGRRYVFGGTTPERGFDCSGLVRYVMAALKVTLPRTAAQQAVVGTEVPKDTSRLRPGDLLTFGRGKRITHIGIYVGEGRFVHASTTAGRVIESSLSRTRSPLVRSWKGARRVVALADSAALSSAISELGAATQ